MQCRFFKMKSTQFRFRHSYSCNWIANNNNQSQLGWPKWSNFPQIPQNLIGKKRFPQGGGGTPSRNPQNSNWQVPLKEITSFRDPCRRGIPGSFSPTSSSPLHHPLGQWKRYSVDTEGLHRKLNSDHQQDCHRAVRQRELLCRNSRRYFESRAHL